MRRSLRTIRKEQTGLGLNTIMDRRLAVTLGTKYVHLAVFAIYDAVRRSQLDPELAALFMAWHKPPEDLVASLAKLWEAPSESAKRLAEHCLRASLTPPLAPPTQARLEALAKGG